MEIDPRGPRFGAVITVVVLAIVLITQSGWLLAAQALVFAIGAVAGLRYAPYGLFYRYLIRPRLGPPEHTEAEAPPRFAQAVGAVFALGGHGIRRSRSGCGFPQCGLRFLPGLPGLPIYKAGPADRLSCRPGLNQEV
jgi:hypothetical protein